jgi:hypothetical protein
VFACAVVAGALLLRWAFPRDARGGGLVDPRSPLFFAAPPLGGILVGVLAFVLNQWLGLRLTPGVWAVASLGPVLVAGWLVNRQATTPSARPRAAPAPWTPVEVACLGAVLLAACVRGQVALHTPVNDWDAFYYHLPHAAAVAGGGFPAELGPSYILAQQAAYPPLPYVLYALCVIEPGGGADYLALKSLTLAAVALTAVFAWHLCRRRLRVGRCGSSVALAWVIAALPLTPNLYAFFAALVSAFAYFAWPLAGRRPATLRQIAIAAIWLVGIYWWGYWGLVFLAAVIGALGLQALLGPGRAARSGGLRQLGLLLAGVVLGSSPHWLRNWIQAGNPLYPAFLEVFGGRGVSEWWLAHRFTAEALPRNPEALAGRLSLHQAPVSMLLLPSLAVYAARLPRRARGWAAVCLLFLLLWVAFLHLSTAPYQRYLGPLVPLAAALGVGAAAASWRQRRRRDLAVLVLLALPAVSVWLGLQRWGPDVVYGGVGLLITLTWLASRRSGRLDQGLPPRLLPAGLGVVGLSGLLALGMLPWPWAAAGAALGLGCLPFPPGEVRRRAVRLSLALVAGAGLALLAWGDVEALDAESLGVGPDLRWLNTLPEGSLIMTAEDRVFLLERDVLPVDSESLRGYYEATDPVVAVDALRQLGVTHVYYGRLLPYRLGLFERQLATFPAVGSPLVTEVHRSPTGVVVSIPPPPRDRWAAAAAHQQALEPWRARSTKATWQALVELPEQLHRDLDAAWRAGDRSRARRVAAELLSLPVQSARELRLQGDAALSLGQHQRAAEAYRRSLESDPAQPATHAALGEVLRTLGQVEAARAAFREALELEPRQPLALQGLRSLEAGR